MKSDFQVKVESIFHNKKILERALTHSSYISEESMPRNESNERLEFLGDAFFDAIIGEYLFNRYPEKTEGELTKLRALVVCEESLAIAAKNLNVGEFIRMGKGEDKSGGRNRPSILADSMEAIIGAMHLDLGYKATRKFVLELFEPIIEDATSGKIKKDYKSIFQEEVQKNGEVRIEYIVIDEWGPSHEKSFKSVVKVNGEKKGIGQGSSKKEAEQKAARDALVKEGYNVF